ncbi:hypothetical protein ABW20_dc0108645 [Dactylellina cionopaga]|nr:hypothetical protein ABW20_dc0108645 [Dactylellina cionopaga]
MSDTTTKVFTFRDFISRVRNQEVSPESLHLGLLTSDLGAYNEYTQILSSLAPEDFPWAKAEIIYLESLPNEKKKDFGFDITHDNRHSAKKDVQAVRRKNLARLRNFLSMHMMTPEIEHVIWLDADVYQLPDGMFKRFVELGNTSVDEDISGMVKAGLKEEGKHDGDKTVGEGRLETPPPIGIITLLCLDYDKADYDRNSWSGFGKRPSREQLAGIFEGREYPGMEGWAKSVKQLIQGTTDDDIVKLDSVGGTALYIRAELLREGLTFPPYRVAGTKWGKDGKDGLETEGMCYVAERLGWGCYALGGNWKTLHPNS